MYLHIQVSSSLGGTTTTRKMTSPGFKRFCIILLCAMIQSAVSVSRKRPDQGTKVRLSPDDPLSGEGKCLCMLPDACQKPGSPPPNSITDNQLSPRSVCQSPKICCETEAPIDDGSPQPSTATSGIEQSPPNQVGAGGKCGLQKATSGRSFKWNSGGPSRSRKTRAVVRSRGPSVQGTTSYAPVSNRIMSYNDSTQIGEFPWMVSVTTSSGMFGGSLIYPGFVLTAAHRVSGKTPADLLIRVGQYDLDVAEGSQERGVSRIIVHENYDPKTLAYDVALLELSSPVDMTQPNVGTICLPLQDEDLTTVNCTTTGWGYNKDSQMQKVLKQVNLGSVLPHDTCNSKLSGALKYSLDRSVICAGGQPGEDSCYGDGGGPLVCPMTDEDANGQQYFIQVGIVVAGIGCGKEFPGMYANVASVANWIASKVGKSSSTSTSPSKSSPRSTFVPRKTGSPPSRPRPHS